MSTVIHRKGQREPKLADPRPTVEQGLEPNHQPAQTESDDQEFAFVRPPGTVESDEPAEPIAKVVFSGRNVEIPDHYRIYVGDKLARLERFDPTIYRFDVELNHERNRRQSKVCQQVEITATGKGPIVRAQACGENFYAALEHALDKVESRLRRVKDRRRVHYGNRRPQSVAEATEVGAPLLRDNQLTVEGHVGDPGMLEATERGEWDDGVDEYIPGQIVRVKEHTAVPMTVDDALYEMELVGHDFFLFHDKESDKPSVVYRRHAFDYGLIRLT
ncbi:MULTISPECIES: ribosome hibernation-promoting factor, HPF/YfiA family [Gordonia]|jgi:ribosomal subunit interface protein|uniref:Ribosome hibernation promoting factor n=1 Tax=Gordonia alkanivorans CGMCC 6845 TaxID=1423140 RepID=W9DJE8_9ACTN|nr:MULTISPECIES: ribosome-associated translation inhibitor RaiA [Gordonia]ETA06731.1 ribosomal subunit interface protein [Gordonia alkanivorans CGMCC 6845]MDH3007384.1 ribosome-associated translation inhibitor RaiA [Gordonia alkanivorans]MDH3011543.1 ribosome-associated translation inhibitor RaiA [Gordonia alkanivorans]MDH3016325.1 ribosome-associated translation inhibitor RaiA [Gordonia alkanivorans]MDH3019591.1 ribosome-associated translation inhibitor RaiA [Gordonia alkanivorans]